MKETHLAFNQSKLSGHFCLMSKVENGLNSVVYPERASLFSENTLESTSISTGDEECSKMQIIYLKRSISNALSI